jgi:hypothetical protein
MVNWWSYLYYLWGGYPLGVILWLKPQVPFCYTMYIVINNKEVK